MTTNADCTVVRMNDDGGYFIIGTHPCMWQEVEAFEVKKYGAENADKALILIPDISADVLKGDRIVRGKLENISEFDTDTALTVMSAARRDFGSPQIRHIQIGAR